MPNPMGRPEIGRRDCLRGMCAAAAATGLAAWANNASGVPPGPLPNILVIMSDEHHAGVMGCAGNSVARTPNLDALAARGVRFENAYTNSPLCVPSRLVFTSGKYCSRVSAWSNDCHLASPDFPSLPGLLARAGYDAVLCGKMHYDEDHRYGFTTEISPKAMNAGKKSGKQKRRAADDLVPKPGISERFEQFHPGESSSVMEHDRVVTEAASKYLAGWRRSDKPFFMLAGYLAPHFPLIVPESYWRNFKDKIPMPVIPEGYLDVMPLNYKHLRLGFNCEDVPPEIVKKGRELYYGLTQWFDEQVGELLKTLDNSAAAQNTVVIYTTDHGENMGEHGLWFKNAMFEPAAHIPLIVSWPARWAGGQRRSGVCSMVDVVQTIAGLAGTRAAEDWNGNSLVALLDNPAASWKDIAVSEYYAHNIASGFVMLRQGHMKYIYHTQADTGHPPVRELYDLKKDPQEFNNLTSHPEYANLLREMHALLVQEVGEDPEETELRSRAELVKGYAS